jgi:hypothetical protein
MIDETLLGVVAEVNDMSNCGLWHDITFVCKGTAGDEELECSLYIYIITSVGVIQSLAATRRR